MGGERAASGLSFLAGAVRGKNALSEEVETLARAIAGPDANAQLQELAHRVPEAQIDLRRVRYARHQLLSNALSDPSHVGVRAYSLTI
jgi:hypothetical protein